MPTVAWQFIWNSRSVNARRLPITTMLPTDKRIAAYSRPGLWEDTDLDTYLTAAAQATPEQTAVIDSRGAWTYAQLDGLVDDLASALQVRGIGRGDVVSWQLPNWVEACVVHLAALRVGAISNPIVSIYRHAEVSFILRQAASKAMFVPARFRGFDYPGMLAEIRAGLPDLHTVVVVGADPDAEAGDIGYEALITQGRSRPPAAVERSANDSALLLYTSGTTAEPKGVLHTHNTLDYEIRSTIEFFGLSRGDVVFMPSPVGHITGVVCGILLPVRLGTTVVLLDVWDAGRALSLVATHRCSYTVAATPFLHGIVHHPDLAEADVSAMRVFMCGGADMPPELITTASAALDCMVTRAYGSTEYPSATGCNQDDPPDKRARTDGRAMRAVQVRVVDDSGSAVAAGVVGDVLVRGPELFIGYLDARLNDEAFTSEGWFRTGDIGRLDADGYLEIVGRRKDIIIRGGENISVKEIEDHLFGHPKITDVAVIASPDPILGERVCAVVVPEAGQSIALAEITEWLRSAQFAKQKLPERLMVLDELPRTASGKVQKFKLRELARMSQPDPESTH
jgi:cyclohexanecarboxylate-CoA ligase